MGLVNHSGFRRAGVRKEYVQACAAAFSLVVFSLAFGPRPNFGTAQTSRPEVRLAYFPNLTHAPALIGVEDQSFQKSLRGYSFSTKVVNAGPEAMEALLAGAIDVAYVGPSPALNTYVKTNGSAIKIIAGVCQGGAALVCRKNLPIHSVADLAGYRVAVPDFGGTQDVSLRHFLKGAGLGPKESGGSVEILPIKNPEILALFKQKEIDAAWVPEPWATRLTEKAGGRVVDQESDLWPTHRFSTTVLVASRKFIDLHPDAISDLIDANQKVIAWIGKHPLDAEKIANAEIGRLTGKPLPSEIVAKAWKNLRFSSNQDRASLSAFVLAAKDAGYINPETEIDDRVWVNNSQFRKRPLVAYAAR